MQHALHEELEEETAARLAEAEEERLLLQRAREAAARAEAATQQAAMAEIDAALDVLENAPGELLRRVREIRAVRGQQLLYNGIAPPPGPSLGGLTDSQMEDVQRRQASADAAWKNEVAARQRWHDEQENQNIIKGLTAGQTEENARQIRAQFAAQKARG